MPTKIPQENQYLVFWIDPDLTLDTYGEEDPELLKAARDLPFRKYVGCVGMVCFTLRSQVDTLTTSREPLNFFQTALDLTQCAF